jgi:hypothetical protein
MPDAHVAVRGFAVEVAERSFGAAPEQRRLLPSRRQLWDLPRAASRQQLPVISREPNEKRTNTDD